MPMVFWLGSLTCAILIVYFDYQSNVATTDDSITKLGLSAINAATAFYCGDIAINLYATCTTTLAHALYI